MKLPLFQIDVFTDTLFSGNPAAVCVLVLAGIVVTTLWLGVRAVESREYVLDQ